MLKNPYFHVLLAGFIWGCNGVFIKWIHLPVPALAAIRLIVPTLLVGIGLVLGFKRNLMKGWRPLMVLASVLNLLRVILYFLGFQLASIGNAILVLYTWPIWVAVFATFVLKEPLTKKMGICLILAIAGVAVIQSGKPFSLSDSDVLGMLVMLVTAMITALTVVLYKAESEYYSHFEGIFYQNSIGAFAAIPLVPWVISTVPLWKIGMASFYAACVGLLGFALFFSALAKMPSSHASFLAYFEVIVTVLTGIFILHEPLTTPMIIGGSLIISALIFSQKSLKTIEPVLDEQHLRGQKT